MRILPFFMLLLFSLMACQSQTQPQIDPQVEEIHPFDELTALSIPRDEIRDIATLQRGAATFSPEMCYEPCLTFSPKGILYAAAYDNGNQQARVFAMDPNLEILWEKSYPFGAGGGYSLVATQEGHLFLAGRGETEQGPNRMIVAKLDNDGNLLWKKDYGSHMGTAGGFLKNGPDGFILLLQKSVKPTYTLKTLDREGKVTAQKEIAFPRVTMVNDMAVDAKGDILFAGNAEKMAPGDFFDGLLAKATADGQVEKYFILKTGQLDELSRIAPLSDGSFIICGYLGLDHSTKNHEKVVAKVDANLNFIWKQKIAETHAGGLDRIIEGKDGKIYLATVGQSFNEYNAFKLFVFQPDGKLEATLTNSSDTGMASPYGMATSPEGDVYMVGKGSRIQVIGL